MDYKHFAARDFKSKRLKKKQITKLNKEYERLRKKHHILGTSMTLSGPVPEKELIVFAIDLIFSSMEIMEKSKRGEIWTIGSDGEGYFPKDKPGFVAK